jgi:transcription factor C subunit 6
MPRELRARTSRPNYASLTAVGGEEDAAVIPPIDDEGDSGSDFAPDKHSVDAPEDIQSDAEDLPDVDKAEAQGAPKGKKPPTTGSRPITPRASTRRVGNGQSHKSPPTAQSAQASTSKMSAPRITKMHALPNPSVHHRHRAIPVFLRKERVERLNTPPKLFNPPDVVPTNSMTSDPLLTDRISKAWGYNVGPGPVWNIMEDRSCFKEALETEENPEYESFRRPRVHQGVAVKPGWTILDEK